MADNGLSNLSALKRLAVKIGEYESTDMVPANNVTEAIDILTQILEGPVAPIEDPEFEGTPTAPDITSESPDDAIANKKYVDDSIEMLGTVVDIKGTKATVADLEAITDAEPGDLWFVAETNSEYIYTSAEEWEEFGPTIDLSGYSLSTNLAAEYSASATYAVGDLCTKDSVLYRCNTAIASPEAWNAAHWTATDVITEAQIKNVKDYGLGNVNGAVVMNDVDNNIANGVYSTAEGYNTRATGNYAHAEGFNMQNAFAKYRGATGQYSHSEGYSTTASGQSSHAEGEGTKASSGGAHAEGYNTTASGENSHVEGQASLASGSNSHAEGESTLASGSYSHAEGHGGEPTANYPTTGAQNDGAHSEGYMTKATGIGAHAEGKYTIASGEGSHAEGGGDGINTNSPTASGPRSHAEGHGTKALYYDTHAEGYKTTAGSSTDGQGAHAEGTSTKATGIGSHAEGTITIASGIGAHAEGSGSDTALLRVEASGSGSHAEGRGTKATGMYSHAEGMCTQATNNYAHSEGYYAEASGEGSHAEGYAENAETLSTNRTKATGKGAHAEGSVTLASGDYSHSEGKNTQARSLATHAEGYYTIAEGKGSHTEGYATRSNRRSHHVFGEYNIPDTGEAGSTTDDRGTYVEIVGNGTASNAQSNARTLDWNGNETLAGKLTVGAAPTGDMDVTTKKYVDEKQASGWVAVDSQYIHISSDLTVNKSKICVLKDTTNKLIYINAILNCNATALTTSTKFIDIDDPDICGPDSLTAAIWIDHQSARLVGNTNTYVGYWPCGQIGIADSAGSLSETSGTYPEIGVVSIISSSGVHPLSFRSGGNVNMSSDASYMIISINRTYCYDNWQ